MFSFKRRNPYTINTATSELLYKGEPTGVVLPAEPVCDDDCLCTYCEGAILAAMERQLDNPEAWWSAAESGEFDHYHQS